MKSFIRQTVFLALLLGSVGFSLQSCQKDDDNENVFGNEYVYMPQALQSGGIDLTYQVPTGLDTTSRNYRIDPVAGTVHIILGVSRSGMQSSAGFSVKVSSNADTVAAAIASGALTAVELPVKDYTLPESVSVPAGQTEATFELSIGIPVLKAYAGKKVAMAVRITDPTRYTLNEDLNETIVVIDVDALNL